MLQKLMAPMALLVLACSLTGCILPYHHGYYGGGGYRHGPGFGPGGPGPGPGPGPGGGYYQH